MSDLHYFPPLQLHFSAHSPDRICSLKPIYFRCVRSILKRSLYVSIQRSCHYNCVVQVQIPRDSRMHAPLHVHLLTTAFLSYLGCSLRKPISAPCGTCTTQLFSLRGVRPGVFRLFIPFYSLFSASQIGWQRHVHIDYQYLLTHWRMHRNHQSFFIFGLFSQ